MERKLPILPHILTLCLILSYTPALGQNHYSGKGVNTIASPAVVEQMLNAVSRDSIVAYVTALQSFGSRGEGTPQREAAAELIVNKLNSWGIKAESDWYTYSQLIINDVHMISSDTICLVGSGQSILITRNGGATWTKSASPSSYDYAAVDFPSSRVGWMAGGAGSIARTTNAGVTWIAQTSGAPTWFSDVGFANEQLGIAVGNKGGIVRTTNGGTTWSIINSGVTASLSRVKVLDALNMWIVASNGAILCSNDGGMTWKAQSSGVTNGLYGVEFINAHLGWAVGLNLTVLKTTNGGTTWMPQSVPPGVAPASANLYNVCFSDSDHGWIVDVGGGIRTTSDGGQTWRRDDLVGLGNTNLTNIKQRGNKYLTTTGSRGAILRSTDQGATWVNQTANLPQEYLPTSRNIVVTIPGLVTPEKVCIMVAHYDSGDCPGADDNGSGTAAVMESARILKSYQFESTIKLIAVSGEELWMVGSGDYALRARNAKQNIIGVVNGDMLGYPLTGDTTRLVVGSYLTRNVLVDQAIGCNQRYKIGAKLDPFVDSTAASDYGPFAIAGYDALEVAEGIPSEIWGGLNPYYHKVGDTVDKLHPGLMRRATQLMLATIAELAQPITNIVDVRNGYEIPAEFALRQNYPNPFNPSTTINYQIPKLSRVSLKVSNVLGQEVAALVDEEKGTGNYQVLWNANVPSGIYFYRLQAGSFVETKKMILLR